jgi:hypothetical protein
MRKSYSFLVFMHSHALEVTHQDQPITLLNVPFHWKQCHVIDIMEDIPLEKKSGPLPSKGLPKLHSSHDMIPQYGSNSTHVNIFQRTSF